MTGWKVQSRWKFPKEPPPKPAPKPTPTWQRKPKPKPEFPMFERISMPLIRKTYPTLIADKLVGVQPLSAPTGLVYYLRYRYGSQNGPVRA